jgi:tetratricopeptide (TPR) repeat protein
MSKLVATAVVVLGLVLGVGVGVAAQSPAPETAPAPGKTEQAAEAQIAAVRDTIVDALWVKTDEYWHSGEIPPVVGICQDLVRLDPHFVEAYSAGAWIATSVGREKEAIELYRQGIALNPDNWDLPHQFGYTYYWTYKHDLDSALPYLKRAAEMDSPVRIKRSYAHALASAGKPHEAAAQWRKILQIEPNERVALRELKKLRDAGKIGAEE